MVPHHTRQRNQRRAFSLLEIIVVVVIVTILLAITLPFLQQMREIARRSNCDQNLIRVSLAIASYEQAHQHLPAGTVRFNADLRVIRENSISRGDVIAKPMENLPNEYHHNFLTAILPWIDRQGLFEQLDRDVSVYHPHNDLTREVSLPMLRCPTAEELTLSVGSNYSGNHASTETPIDANNDGLLFADRWIARDAIADGEGSTVLLWESRTPPSLELGWMSGTRSTLRNGGHPINESFGFVRDPKDFVIPDPLYVGGAGSFHVGGSSVAMADGSVRFLTETADPTIVKTQACRDDETFGDR